MLSAQSRATLRWYHPERSRRGERGKGGTPAPAIASLGAGGRSNPYGQGGSAQGMLSAVGSLPQTPKGAGGAEPLVNR